VQTIRDILDHQGLALVVQENQLAPTLAKLAVPPNLVITDSQVIKEVAAVVSQDIPLTTFSTLFARVKGDLEIMVEGVRTIDRLKSGDRVLIAEACTHHALTDDIGRIKIPRWIREHTGEDIIFDVKAGPSFNHQLQDYRLVIQCGGCTITREAYLNRIASAISQGVPITNYGIAISYVQGVLERVIKPFAPLPGSDS